MTISGFMRILAVLRGCHFRIFSNPRSQNVFIFNKYNKVCRRYGRLINISVLYAGRTANFNFFLHLGLAE